MMKAYSIFRHLAVVAMLVSLVACGGQQALAPLGRQVDKPASTVAVSRDPAPKSHTVRRGETVYAIAWAYGLDYRDIAAWNRIAEPYTIYPGQRLELHSPAPQSGPEKITKPKPLIKATRTRKTVPPAPSPPPKVTPGTSKKITVRAKKAAVTKPTGYTGAAVKKWQWPTKGKLIGAFNKGGGKGINIQGRRGQPVYTAAAGRVVYSGSGLRGYGKLIIIKHNKRFLSAYAHNQQLQVREGDIVKSGQQIAQMGNTESREIKLHFEIRRDGRPVNPIQYLP